MSRAECRARVFAAVAVTCALWAGLTAVLLLAEPAPYERQVECPASQVLDS